MLDRVQDYAFELSDRSGGNQFANSIAGLRIVDNIVVGSPLYVIRNALPASVTLDYNLAWPRRGACLAQLPGHGTASSLAELTRISGYEAHGVMADPRFVDGAAHDYHLAGGERGARPRDSIAPGEAYLGPAPDIGRYEGPTALPSGFVTRPDPLDGAGGEVPRICPDQGQGRTAGHLGRARPSPRRP